jgi:hypothetical protein
MQVRLYLCKVTNNKSKRALNGALMTDIWIINSNFAPQMKKIALLVLAVCMAASMDAQTSRKKIEKFADEAVRQIALTGRKPTIDILDSLSNNAEVSVEMVSRMGAPDDARQQRACLRLIDDIVDFSQQETGRKYTDVIRKGLTKALDRSFEPDVQLHVMEQLARIAKPADAAHIAMYLEMPELAQTASDILVNMPDIDDRIAEAAAAQPGIKQKVQTILDIRAGKRPKQTAVTTVAKPKPAAIPMWTESLDKEVAGMYHAPMPKADSILIRKDTPEALRDLLKMAANMEGTERNSVLARFVTLAGQSAQTGSINAAEHYLMLRAADELVTDNTLRSKIIVDMGTTHSVQALSYLRRYTGKAPFIDAMAVATAETVSTHPEANGGRSVSAMLYSAKQSFINHYDEQGIDTYIDQVLAAIDNWKQAAGYDMSHTDQTKMEKRGFWILHEELDDCDLVFDWKASGRLTLSLHSSPVITFDTTMGVKIAGENKWHKVKNICEWSTASVSLKGDAVTVSVNGQKVADGVKLPSMIDGEPMAKSGQTRFLADDDGATVREFCFLRR